MIRARCAHLTMRRLRGASFVVALVAAAPSVRAQEGRLYLRGDDVVYRLHSTTAELSLGPFLKTESRFREEGLVFEKMSVGMKARVLPWLTLQTYYAHKDAFEAGHSQKHMAVGDVVIALEPATFRLSDRNGNEWHITDGFYRYRNDIEMLWHTPADWLDLWASEELRADSDQERVNENDVALGVQLAPAKDLSVRLFYDIESLRRRKPRWNDSWFTGLSVSLRAGAAPSAGCKELDAPGADATQTVASGRAQR